VEAEVVLRSRSETPIDAVEARLRGVEQRGITSSEASLLTHAHVDLVARTKEALLTPGEHRFRFRFDLPRSAPPQYTSRTARVLYDLEVRVEIPWWPDRTARFLVPVAAVPTSAAHAPAAFCTDARGPQETALYLEASLDTTSIAVRGTLRGAVSASNVALHRVRRLDLALVQRECPRGVREGVEARRYVVKLASGPPEDGKPIPFQVQLPADAPVSFQGALIEARWHLEIRAVVTLGSDVTLVVPFTVHRAPDGAVDAGAMMRRVPPVGHQRRALVWAEAARNLHLSYDADGERMSRDLGRVALGVTLERKASGLALTAAITWPSLGLGLAVTERRWLDAWAGRACSIDAPAFAERFTAKGREDAQVRALLGPALRGWLLRFDEAAMDDEGATLATASAAQSVEELSAFVALASRTAEALADALDALPPPAAMTAAAPAWRAFASTIGGRFVVGDMSIRDATLDDCALSIATAWSDEAEPRATVIMVKLPARDAAAAPVLEALDATARAIIESLTTGSGASGTSVSPRVASVDVGGETDTTITATLAGPLVDPSTLEPVLAGLGQLARRLTGGGARGPYR
jgi:hypothetical protein